MKARREIAGEARYWSTTEGSEELRQINEQIDRITLGAARTVPAERPPRRLAFGRILVGWDGSVHADRAVDWAIALAKVYHGSIDVASIIPLHASNELYRERGLAEAEEDMAQAQLRYAYQRAERRHVPVRTHVLHGSPVRQLAEAARKHRASLVIVGFRGRSRVTEMIMGGTASGIVNEAPVSVLVARTPPPAGRLLVPTDGSVASEEAAYVAADLQRAWKIPGTLVHVVAPPSFGPPERARRAFNRLFAPFGKNQETKTGLDVDIRFGPPAKQIVEAAHEGHADLILMGSRGLGGLRSFVAGSVSAAVVARASNSSVLLIKEPE